MSTRASGGSAGRPIRCALVVLIIGAAITIPGRAARASCGNSVKEGSEECDDGGQCVGGDNAGTACTGDGQCHGNGVCVGGAKTGLSCASPTECGTGKCVHCRTFGGDGCAANCTLESDVTFDLKNGATMGTNIIPGTTGAVVHGDILTIPLPIGSTCTGGNNIDVVCSTDADCPGATCGPNATQKLTVGKNTGDGNIPFVIKASSVFLPRIKVGSLACACVRGVAAKTCGGSLFNADGTTSTPCSPVFTDGDSVCPADKKCQFVNGPGNSATGLVGCNGLDGVDITFNQDSGGSSGVAGLPMITFSGHGGPGSAIVINTSAIGVAVGACDGPDTTVYGDDGKLCTDDDPLSSRGIPATLPQTTGTASGTVFNANGQDGVNVGPFSIAGAPFSCTGGSVNVQSGGLVGVFTVLGQATIGDSVVTSQFFGTASTRPTPQPTLTGRPTSISTRTPTPTAAPGHASIDVGSADGSPGQRVSFAVTLDTAGQAVAGTQNDISFDAHNAPVAARPDGTPDCAANFNINKAATTFGFLPVGCTAAACTQIRSVVFSTTNSNAIPNGATLYTCAVTIAPSAPAGDYPLTIANTIAASPSGNSVPVVGTNGAITVDSTQNHIEFGSADGVPNNEVPVTVTLRASNQQVAGVQVDIDFAPSTSVVATADGHPGCSVNPAINKNGTAFTFQPLGCTPGANCDRVRAIVIAFDNSAPIADGAVLFTCAVAIARTAIAGSHSLTCFGARGSDPSGGPVRVGCTGGTILVKQACLGDCNGDHAVTVEELVTGVQIALGTIPSTDCPAFDTNGDGEITIDELVVGVNRALGGCPAT